VRCFSHLGALLTDITKHGDFIWTKESHKSFDYMKEVMGTCPMLALPDFTFPFLLECDTSRESIKEFLMKGGHPIVFERNNISQPERLYSIYDKEMLVIMHALNKFKQYLVGNKFVVNIDHNKLKYFLEQKDLSEHHQKWVMKVQEFNFDIEYAKGNKNIVADALSRRPATCSLMEFSVDWKSHLLVQYSKNKFTCEVMDGKIKDDRYRVIDNVIFYKDIVYLVPCLRLNKKILTIVHDSPLTGHHGFFKTYR
jgi:hypothetical protein